VESQLAKRPWLRPLITGAFYVALLAFLALYLINVDWSVFASITINPWFLALGLATGVGFRYWQTFIWITVLRGLGAKDVRMNAELTHVYAKSWLGRYIPGTAPWILGKIYFASQHGVSKSKLAVGSLLEAAIQIATLLLTASVTLLFDARLSVLGAGFTWTMVAVIVLALVALCPPVFNFFIALVFRILRRPALGPENRAGWRTILTAVGQYTVGAFISGIFLFSIAKALYADLPWSDAFYIVAAGNLAGAASMLAIFAPGGVGVRESVQLLLLGVVMPAGIAVLVALSTRLTGIIADFVFFGVTWIARRRSRGSATDQQPIDGPQDPTPV
jgi:glycosyltransferase 2 family protein